MTTVENIHKKHDKFGVCCADYLVKVDFFFVNSLARKKSVCVCVDYLLLSIVAVE